MFFWFLGGRERLVWVMWVRFLDWGFSRCVCKIRRLVSDLVGTNLEKLVDMANGILIELLGDYVSAFTVGGTVAASWDRRVFYERGFQMGMEQRGKGVDVLLGPVVGPLGRNPKGGRNWEGALFHIRTHCDCILTRFNRLQPRPCPLRYCGCRDCQRHSGCGSHCLHETLYS